MCTAIGAKASVVGYQKGAEITEITGWPHTPHAPMHQNRVAVEKPDKPQIMPGVCPYHKLDTCTVKSPSNSSAVLCCGFKRESRFNTAAYSQQQGRTSLLQSTKGQHRNKSTQAPQNK
jgi:hypothetical protein